MIDGGDGICRFGWDDVGLIFNCGGIVIGIFCCKGMCECLGCLKVVRNFFEYGIDCFVVIGGDGLFIGLDVLCIEWIDLVVEFVDIG